MISDKVFCSKHGYQFSIISGEAEYSDSIESIERFQVNENDNNISIILPTEFKKYYLNYKKSSGIDFNHTVLIGNVYKWFY